MGLTTTDHFIISGSNIMEVFPDACNSALCFDSLYTSGRDTINFYCSPSPFSKVFFCSSFLFGILTAIVSAYTGIPVVGLIGTFGATCFNRLGKYTLQMGNITNGNITNATEIGNLMY